MTLESESLRQGLNLFLVGIIKKVMIADNIAPFVDLIFESPGDMPSPVIVMGAAAFGVQIYCDFSGYTDMARGAARMLGFDIPINFDYPYFARSIREFWRKWHVSLSTWFRDYLYISMGGGRCSLVFTCFRSSCSPGCGRPSRLPLSTSSFNARREA